MSVLESRERCESCNEILYERDRPYYEEVDCEICKAKICTNCEDDAHGHHMCSDCIDEGLEKFKSEPIIDTSDIKGIVGLTFEGIFEEVMGAYSMMSGDIEPSASIRIDEIKKELEDILIAFIKGNEREVKK